MWGTCTVFIECWTIQETFYLSRVCAWERNICVCSVFCFLSVWLVHHIFRCFFYISFPLKMNKSFIFFSISNFFSCLARCLTCFSVSIFQFSLLHGLPSAPLPHLIHYSQHSITNITWLPSCHFHVAFFFFFPLHLFLSFSVCQIWLILWSDCWPSTTICLKSLSPTPWAGTVRQKAGKWEAGKKNKKGVATNVVTCLKPLLWSDRKRERLKIILV